MNPADLLLKLADYFTTLRLAVKTVFVTVGMISCLYLIFPLLQTWIPLTGTSSKNYAFEVHIVLTLMLGLGLGNILFYFSDLLLQKYNAFRKKSLEVRLKVKEQSLELKKQEELSLDFKDKFKLAYSHINSECILVLYELKRKPHSYLRHSSNIHYLSRQEWIIPTVDLGDNIYIYELDKRIAEALSEIRNNEVELKSTGFIESEKKGCKKVLEFFLTDLAKPQPKYLSKRDFLEARSDYYYCFNIQCSGNTITIAFQADFHDYFENIFKEKIPFGITVELVD